MAEGQVELTDEKAGPESGQLLSQGHDLLLDLRRSLARLSVRGARAFDQTCRPLLLVAPQPFPHRGHGGGESAGRGFDPELTGILN